MKLGQRTLDVNNSLLCMYGTARDHIRFGLLEQENRERGLRMQLELFCFTSWETFSIRD